MTDENPKPRVSNRMTPLFWIIIGILVILVAIAIWRWNGHVHTPSGQYAAPVQQPSAITAPIPRQRSHVPNGPGPTSDANGGEAREANPSPNEPGGPETTGGARGTGGANTTGNATGGPT